VRRGRRRKALLAGRVQQMRSEKEPPIWDKEVKKRK